MKLTNKDRLRIHENICEKLRQTIEKEDKLADVIKQISKAKPVELRLIPTYKFEGSDLIAEMNYCNNIIERNRELIRDMYSQVLLGGI